MGFQPNQNNCIVWNAPKGRYEAWGMHSERGLMLFSYDPGNPDGTIDQKWIRVLWQHMIDQTEEVTIDHLKRGALFEFVNAERQGAR